MRLFPVYLGHSHCRAIISEFSLTVFFWAFSAAEMADATPSVFRGQAMRISTLLKASVFVSVSKLTTEFLQFERSRSTPMDLVVKALLELQRPSTFLNWNGRILRFVAH
jgi:hypothetical protein